MSDFVNIDIKYLTDLGELEQHGDWIDLYAAEDVVLKKDEFKLIPLGICMKLPKGYEAHVVPRSGTFKKYGIIQTNGVGIIDEAYCGDNDEWKMPVQCTNPTDFVNGQRVSVIKRGTRICQFRLFEHQRPIIWNIVDKMSGTDRGGFGSSGV